MVDSVNNNYSYNSGSVNIFGNKGKQNPDANGTEEQNLNETPDYKETQVDPSKVMDWLAANNNFANIVKPAAKVEGVVTDPTIEGRVAGFMERYEYFMSIIEAEFGVELAPTIMDMPEVMDVLMGME